MAKTKKFRELVARMPAGSRRRAEAETRRLMEEMPLQALRRALALTQEELAARSGLSQSGVAQIEQRSDMFVSTLRRFVEAMGGELVITARFPFGETTISQFVSAEAPPKRAVARKQG